MARRCRRRVVGFGETELQQTGLTLAVYEEVGRLLAVLDLFGDLIVIKMANSDPDFLEGEDLFGDSGSEEPVTVGRDFDDED